MFENTDFCVFHQNRVLVKVLQSFKYFHSENLNINKQQNAQTNKNLFLHILMFVNSCFHTKFNVRMYK